VIATNPYYIAGYRGCHCIWTVCQCYSYQQGAYYDVPLWGGYIAQEPLSKALSNKRHMESLRVNADIRPRPRVRLPMPSIRPSVQALSMRIR
jgi:hypothetical protein